MQIVYGFMVLGNAVIGRGIETESATRSRIENGIDIEIESASGSKSEAKPKLGFVERFVDIFEGLFLEKTVAVDGRTFGFRLDTKYLFSNYTVHQAFPHELFCRKKM
ncbi:hypothetical protein EVAR_38144_1 [Eumeta japonica]|uniref:Uncharacterized protein n=1 Tax=Eumeta variegata TaxID=151549 RepID=A0A4C1YM91_EUMVA|nr:hypothetical protein EVAR_38144_1 [Eumeta japonica]